jgi:glycosyltransferase involved in cell wall biosynthesis
VLLVVENCPVPRDIRVKREADTLRDAGCTVSVISPTGPDCPDRFEVVDGVAVFRHPTHEGHTAFGYLLEYANALVWELALAVEVLRRRGFDVIHIANPPDLLFVVAALFKPFGVQVVFDHHDLCPELFAAKFHRRGLLWRSQVLLERLTFRTADISIATNESFRRVAIGRGGMDPADVFVVRNGPDLGEVAAPTDAVGLRRGRRHLVAFAGVMGSQDGVDLLLDAAKLLVVDQGRDVQFVLVGSGSELARLRSRADELGLGGHVTFTGLLPHAELLGVLDEADVCVSPDDVNALNDRSTMIKVLEYMAAGKPVVQFDLAEGRASAGDAALYAGDDDPADLAARIAELLDDPDLRARLGQLGRARIESRLAWQHQAPALLAAYARLEHKRVDRHRRRHHHGPVGTTVSGGVR